MKFIEFFDCAYVINLPNRADRRKKIAKELENAGMPFTSGKVELFSAIRPESPGSFPSIGFRGSFLSRLNVLKKARERGLKNVLIMEDDLELRKDFKQYEEIILGELIERDWDIVHFGYLCDEPCKDVNLPILQPFSGEIRGGHFYAVNGKVFDQLINFFEVLLQRPGGHPEGGPMSGDGVFNAFKWQHPNIARLIAVPSFADQRSSKSDISPQWYDNLPVLGFLLALARKLGFARSFKNLFKSVSLMI